MIIPLYICIYMLPTSFSEDDHTRVELKGDPDRDGSDYINASFIDVSYLYCRGIWYVIFTVFPLAVHRDTQTRNMPTLLLKVYTQCIEELYTQWSYE